MWYASWLLWSWWLQGTRVQFCDLFSLRSMQTFPCEKIFPHFQPCFVGFFAPFQFLRGQNALFVLRVKTLASQVRQRTVPHVYLFSDQLLFMVDKLVLRTHWSCGRAHEFERNGAQRNATQRNATHQIFASLIFSIFCRRLLSGHPNTN